MGNLGFQELLLIVVLGGILLVGIFYLLTLQNTLKTISPENRKMEPGNVWFLLIPLVNIVYSFIVVDAIGVSLKNEYEKYGVVTAEKPAYNIGLAMCILNILSVIPFVGIVTFLCWIIYWVKVNEHKNEIIRLQNANDPLRL
ncbi:MAG TPA: hypothetical protein PLP23_19315 [Panacibacter sp.]|nr:hypothetical protein [Panacibacter sp.]